MSGWSTAKFLPFVSHFLRKNYTIPDARRCRYRQCFTENCQKVGETRVDSQERSPSIVRDGITGGGRKRTTGPATMHYLNFKSPSKCRLNSLVLYPISSYTTENAGNRRARDLYMRWHVRKCAECTCDRTALWRSRMWYRYVSVETLISYINLLLKKRIIIIIESIV